MDSWRTFLPSLGTVISSPLRFWRKFARSDGKKLRGFWNECSLKNVSLNSKHVKKKRVRNQLVLSWWFCFFFCELLIALLFGLHHQLFGCFACGEFNDLPSEVLCVGWWLLKKHPRSGIPLIIYPTLMPLWAQFVWVISAHRVWVNPGWTCSGTIGCKYVLN